jgi:hypothetical protein
MPGPAAAAVMWGAAAPQPTSYKSEQEAVVYAPLAVGYVQHRVAFSGRCLAICGELRLALHVSCI